MGNDKVNTWHLIFYRCKWCNAFSIKSLSWGIGAFPTTLTCRQYVVDPENQSKGPVESTRQIRRLIQACFDKAASALREKKLFDEADALETATVHWLRHTGISDDVNKRGRPI